jgi:SAM-dependent methyltransferase
VTDLDFDDPPAGPGMLELLTTGFAWSSIVWTAVELGVFDALAQPSEPAALALELGLDRGALERLLGALCAVRLVDHDETDGRYRLTPLSAAALTRDGAQSIVAIVRQTHHQFYELFQHLPEALRTGRPPLERWKLHRPGAETCYDSLLHEPQEYELLLAGTDAASAGVAEVIARQAGVANVRHLVDLGHGGGRLARDFLAQHPDLRVTAVDLPPAIAYARARALDAGLSHRIRFVEADIRRPLPEIEPADAVLLSGVLSEFEPHARARLVEIARDLLKPGGMVLVSETLFDEGRRGPLMPAVLSMCMLLVTGGDNFTGTELEDMLTRAGLHRVRVESGRALGVRDLVIGYRPS